MNLQSNYSGQPALQNLHCWIDGLRQTSQMLENQRAAPRYPVGGPVYLGVRSLQKQGFVSMYEAWATDVCCEGIGLLIERPLERNVELYVDLEPLMERPCVLMMRIVYCRQLLTRAYRIGGVFLNAAD